MAKRRRRRSMPAGLRRYWASHRRGRRSNPRRRRRNRSHAIVRYRMRSAPMRRYRRRRRSNPRRYRRHRNPSAMFSGIGTKDLMWMGGGALVNGIACRAIPQMVPFLSGYNTGLTGYALNVGVGGVGAWAIGKFNRRAGQGAWIGLVVALGQRIIADNFGSGSAGSSGGMSGDLDFDLGYYISDRFPYPQGPGGPYGQFPGTPYVGAPQFANTSASAVRAGQAAAAAALPAASVPAAAAGAANAQASQMDRWSGAWS